MIKKIRSDYYKVQVNKTVYYIQICSFRIDEYSNYSYLNCTNRENVWSYFHRLNLYNVGQIANRFLGFKKFPKWYWHLNFDTKEQAIGFLYYLEENYNGFKDNTFKNLNYYIF